MKEELNPIDDARRTRVRALVASARSQVSGSVRQLDEGPHQGDLPVSNFLPGYQISDELYRGGQGVIYRAQQRSTGRTVAVKVMREGPFSSAGDRARFEREVEVLGQLNHPNIVGIVDSGMAAGSHYFIMEFVQGLPLDRWIAGLPGPASKAPHKSESSRNARIAYRHILGLFAKICDAVHAAHLRGIIHRDLKPNNVLIDETGEPHILDFGLAKLNSPEANGADGVTVTGQFIGTLPWASPEQAEGANQIDIRTDVYSLGVMLYQALTARFPYSVIGSIHDVLGNIMRVEPSRPSVHCRFSNDELDTITLKCLAKDRARRYESAGELARDLRHFLADEPIEAKRDSTWYVLRKSVRRHRIPMAVAGLFIVLLAGSTLVMSVLSIRAGRLGREAIHNLHDSLVLQARATRRSGFAGQRFDALNALTRAAQLDPTLEVRNEAIAALATPDLRSLHRFDYIGTTCYDGDLARCAVSKSDGEVSIFRMDDGVETARIPPPTGGLVEIFRLALRGPIFVRLFDPPTGLRRLEIWRIGTAKPVFELEDVPFRARFDISPDGRTLAIGRTDHAIHLYDLETMKVIKRIELDRDPSYLTFDSTAQRLVLYHGNFESAKLLNLESGKLEPIFDSPSIRWSVVWQPNGPVVAGAAFNNVELWDANSRQRIALLSGHEDQIIQLVFSHDGNMLLSYGWNGGAVLWDIRTKRVILRTYLTGAEFGKDDQQLAGLSSTPKGTAIDLLQLEFNSPRRCMIAKGNTEATSYACGAFEPHSGLLFMCNPLIGGAVSRFFEPWSGRELACEALDGAFPMAMDTGGRFIVGSTKNGLFRWPLRVNPARVEIGEPVRVHGPGTVSTIQLSSNGDVALSSDHNRGEFQILNLRAQDTPARLINCGRRTGSAHMSPDGRWVAIGIWYGSAAEVWDALSARRVTTLPLSGNSTVEFSPDGKMLATSDNQGLELWRTESWQLLRHSPQRGSLCGFSPDGRLLVLSTDSNRLRMIDSATLKEAATLESPESFSTKAIAFSPDGTLLAQFTNRKGVVHLWDLRSLRTELAAMGLDWNDPPYAPATPESRIEWRVTTDH